MKVIVGAPEMIKLLGIEQKHGAHVVIGQEEGTVAEIVAVVMGQEIAFLVEGQDGMMVRQPAHC